MVRAHKPGDIRRQIYLRSRRQRQSQVTATQLQRLANRGDIGRPGQLRDGQAGKEVVHHGVADHDRVDDLLLHDAGIPAQLRHQGIKRLGQAGL